MRGKLTLKLEDLAVDTFDTTAPRKARGTVFGGQCTCWTQCAQVTCPGCPTCYAATCETSPTDDATCTGTCGDTCPDTCAGCNYSDRCNSIQPCPTALYTACNGYDCL